MQNKQIIFKDKDHKNFYNDQIMQYAKAGRTVDCYIKPLFYLLSLSPDTRRNFNNLYDMETGGIKPEGVKGAWLTDTTSHVCHLAFNLYNGWTQEGRKKCSENYTPYYLFACEYAPYFVQAILLRYPEYFRTRLD